MKNVIKSTLMKAVRKCAPIYYNQHLESALETRVHWVSPSDIEYVTAENQPELDYYTACIVGGDWDRLTLQFDKTDFYQALKVVLTQSGNWEQTSWYHKILMKIKSGEYLWGCKDKIEFDERLTRIEWLYDEIKKYGYVRAQNRDEITVNVGRCGDILLNDGSHRLAIAKLLGISKVPVRIVARHLEWIKFKNLILEYAQSHKGGCYSPLMHPDLEWIPSFYSHKRFELIKRVIISKKGRMLDIGCNWGYFCQRFEKELLFECVGVEANPWCYFFLERLKRASKCGFEIVNKSIFNYETDGVYDVVLALAIFHHFVKTKESLSELKILLSKLSVREMFFIPHLQSEDQMKDAYWNPDEHEFVQFIIDNCPALKRAEIVGYIEDGRKMYHLVD